MGSWRDFASHHRLPALTYSTKSRHDPPLIFQGPGPRPAASRPREFTTRPRAFRLGKCWWWGALALVVAFSPARSSISDTCLKGAVQRKRGQFRRNAGEKKRGQVGVVPEFTDTWMKYHSPHDRTALDCDGRAPDTSAGCCRTSRCHRTRLRGCMPTRD